MENRSLLLLGVFFTDDSEITLGDIAPLAEGKSEAEVIDGEDTVLDLPSKEELAEERRLSLPPAAATVEDFPDAPDWREANEFLLDEIGEEAYHALRFNRKKLGMDDARAIARDRKRRQ